MPSTRLVLPLLAAVSRDASGPRRAPCFSLAKAESRARGATGVRTCEAETPPSLGNSKSASMTKRDTNAELFCNVFPEEQASSQAKAR
ncbi:hypothetical protein NDU88_006660 [Pleurodeles waltl]|uniref:Secreted protein n=1 Tax=Pleurodeles waltl TaxID=8319 RepID=A0AAV7MEN3_PLEWA|nr:hypothetical protein NDU88_006660 [Pleurodeles waltl]